MTGLRRRPPVTKTFRVGPFKSVRSTTDPLDDPPFLLVDATNLYNPDPEGASGFYALPGLTLENGGVAIGTGRGQGMFTHTDESNTTTNFEIWNGAMYRISSDRTTFTDVTPTTIDADATTRVYGTSFGNQLIVTDGVNTPWLATNLSSTPITATEIDFDSAGSPWTAFGPFVIYAGSLFCIIGDVNGVAARTDIAWSLPADASQGWQQTDFDFRWTLQQTGSDPLYGLSAENTQLYYFRESSIGSISGIPGPDLQGQSTHDAISQNVGTRAPQSIKQFGSNIFFTDVMGRPYRLESGTRVLDPIWLNMRAIVDASSFGFPDITQTVTTAAIEPVLSLYIVAPFSALPSQTGPATEAYIFSARTGAYFGRFRVADGAQIETLGVLFDGDGLGVLVIQGSAVAPTGATLGTSGFMWSLNRLSGSGDVLTTEAGVVLTTEGSVSLTLEGATVDWNDNGSPKAISATTTRMGYDPETVISVDRATALVGSTAPCSVSATTAAIAQTLEGTPTPSTVQDGISRVVCGFDGVQGRGVEITISPTTTDEQWSLQAVAVQAVESLAPPDEV